MGNYTIKKIGYIIVIIAIFITILFEVKAAIGAIPKDFGFLFFIFYILINCWILMPYILMGFVLRYLGVTRLILILNCVAIFIISAGGLYMYLDAIYIHPDAQGGIALLFIPAFQISAYLILALLLGFMELYFRKFKL